MAAARTPRDDYLLVIQRNGDVKSYPVRDLLSSSYDSKKQILTRTYYSGVVTETKDNIERTTGRGKSYDMYEIPGYYWIQYLFEDCFLVKSNESGKKRIVIVNLSNHSFDFLSPLNMDVESAMFNNGILTCMSNGDLYAMISPISLNQEWYKLKTPKVKYWYGEAPNLTAVFEDYNFVRDDSEFWFHAAYQAEGIVYTHFGISQKGKAYFQYPNGDPLIMDFGMPVKKFIPLAMNNYILIDMDNKIINRVGDVSTELAVIPEGEIEWNIVDDVLLLHLRTIPKEYQKGLKLRFTGLLPARIEESPSPSRDLETPGRVQLSRTDIVNLSAGEIREILEIRNMRWPRIKDVDPFTIPFPGLRALSWADGDMSVSIDPNSTYLDLYKQTENLHKSSRRRTPSLNITGYTVLEDSPFIVRAVTST